MADKAFMSKEDEDNRSGMDLRLIELQNQSRMAVL